MSRIAAYAVAAALVLAGLIWAVVAYGGRQYLAGQAAEVAAQAVADKTAKDAEDKIQQAAHTASQEAVAQGEQTQAVTAATTKTVVQTVTRIVHDKPTPVTCVLPDDSVQQLTAAALRANTAADRVSGAQTISQDTPAGSANP